LDRKSKRKTDAESHVNESDELMCVRWDEGDGGDKNLEWITSCSWRWDEWCTSNRAV